ncbi:Glycoside hydrolase 35 catalytic domain [Trinorchestia longiramus]|nr:Glycoside hydrolase 35 catalytic domain [Trinorchestia longiramus]
MPEDYMGRVRSWLLQGLFPRIRSLLYHNGGSIIMAQIENEYGNFYACDYSYTSALRRIFKEGLGDEILLFSTDNGSPSALRCGKIPLVYATVDFGIHADPLSEFHAERLFEPSGPLVNSEFYSGWLDHWGESRHKVNTSEFVEALDKILSLKASVNIYMFHGGTNFGFSAGADEAYGHYTSCLTTYDYDAPLSEAGDMTQKFDAVRQVIGKYLPLPRVSVPSNSSKKAYGRVSMFRVGSHVAVATDGLLESVHAPFPLTFEQLQVFSGIVVYSTIVNFSTPDPSILNLGAVHDRGYVLVNGVRRGTVSRSLSTTALPVRSRPGDQLIIVVESLGRINVGTGINDFKGLTSNVTLNSKVLTNWTMTPLPLTNYDRLNSALRKLRLHTEMITRAKASTDSSAVDVTGFYHGTFDVSDDSEPPRDTFLKFDGWTKGIAWINDFCLGRYWPTMGPQNTLYVPHGTLKFGINEVLLLELEDAKRCDSSTEDQHRSELGLEVNANTKWDRELGNQIIRSCTVEFVDTPDIDAPVPE